MIKGVIGRTNRSTGNIELTRLAMNVDSGDLFRVIWTAEKVGQPCLQSNKPSHRNQKRGHHNFDEIRGKIGSINSRDIFSVRLANIVYETS